jgi:hypothetical protein
MMHRHPGAVALARLSAEESASGVARHVRSCARCRRVVSDFGWLDGRLADTLAGVAEELPAPRPAWSVVRRRLQTSQHRLLVKRQLSAMASAALVACVLLSVPGLIRPAAAPGGLQPSAALRPTPTVVAVPLASGGGSVPSGTSSVASGARPGSSEPVPALEPLPTPPESVP